MGQSFKLEMSLVSFVGGEEIQEGGKAMADVTKRVPSNILVHSFAKCTVKTP